MFSKYLSCQGIARKGKLIKIRNYQTLPEQKCPSARLPITHSYPAHARHATIHWQANSLIAPHTIQNAKAFRQTSLSSAILHPQSKPQINGACFSVSLSLCTTNTIQEEPEVLQLLGSGLGRPHRQLDPGQGGQPPGQRQLRQLRDHRRPRAPLRPALRLEGQLLRRQSRDPLEPGECAPGNR